MPDITASHVRTERDSATGRLLTAYRDEGDTRARDRLVRLYMPLVEAFAQSYGRPGADYEDLVDAGSIGLLHAIERFDPRRGDEFASYAVPTIAGEIRRHLRDRTTALPQSGDADLDDRILLSDAFAALDDTERAIVYLRYVREAGRRESAQQLGMTEDRLRAAAKGALSKLRRDLEGRAFRGVAADPPEPDGEPASLAPTAIEADSPARPEPDARRPEPRSGRLLVRMTPALHDALARAADHERVSLNQFVTNALSAAVAGDRGGKPDRSPAPRWLPAAIVTNIVVLVVTGVVAIVLLLVALDKGL